MLRFALKNMAIKKVQIVLIILSIMVSAGVAVLAFNIGEQVSDGITGSAAYYSAIIGPSGSQTQLAMNTMYFSDKPLGTIPYAVVSALQQDSRVSLTIPFAMADSYNGFSCVGTTPDYLAGKEVAQGEMFSAEGSMEVVLGYHVAQTCDVQVGDEIFTSHSVGDVHHQPLTVKGILAQSHTAFDNVVFTQLKTIWQVHEAEEEEAHEEEQDEAGHAHAGTVCAVLVKATNPGTAMTLVNDYDGRFFSDADGDTSVLQAIEPMNTVRGVLEENDNTKYIVFALCAIILVMNVIIISVITALNMVHSAKEISLMRLIGVSMRRINLLYLIQNSIIGLVSILLAFGLSRLCLMLAGDYVWSMGVVLDLTKVYPLELVILIAVFVLSILPTLVTTFLMARRDSAAA